jgi:hypothetical protein
MLAASSTRRVVSALCLVSTTSAGLDGLQCGGQSCSLWPVPYVQCPAPFAFEAHKVETKGIELATACRAISTYMHECYTCEAFSVTSTPGLRLLMCHIWAPSERLHCSICCSKIAEAEAAVSVNEKKWLVMHMQVQLKPDQRGCMRSCSSLEVRNADVAARLLSARCRHCLLHHRLPWSHHTLHPDCLNTHDLNLRH